MRRKWLFLITCGALLLSSLTLNDAHATSPSNLPSFNQNSPGINFDGGAYSTIEISANPNFEVGCDDFTIDWWQKASSQQSSYPRLFQFGDSDGFAVSQEGGNFYFWLNATPPPSGVQGENLNFALPVDSAPLVWNHFAIVRKSTIISIYVNGISQTLNGNISNGTCTPGTIDSQSLLIGGSNDPALGGFNGQITGFEFFKGAKWDSNFTPPTEYSTEVCQERNLSNPDPSTNCILESILLIYPTEDFNTSPSGLTNLISDQSILVNTGVTYSDPSPSPTPTPTPTPTAENLDITFVPPVGGDFCIIKVATFQHCALEPVSNLSLANASGAFFEINPDVGYSFASVTVTPLNALPITQDTFGGDFSVTDEFGVEYIFEWNADSNLIIPSAMTDFEIEFSFAESIEVNLNSSLNGLVCVDDFADERICAESVNQLITFYKDITNNIYFYADEGYEINSVSIEPESADSVTSPFGIDFLVEDDQGSTFNFVWANDTTLTIPSGFSNFTFNVIFSEISAPAIEFPSSASGPYSFDDYYPFEISSIEGPTSPNDYSIVGSILFSIRYDSNNPLDPSGPSTRNFCRGFINDWQISDDSAEIAVWLDKLSYLVDDCPFYHQSSAIVLGDLYLFDAPEIPIEGIDEAYLSGALQRVQIAVISPPGVEEFLSDVNVNENEVIKFTPSNIDNANKVRLTLYSDRFIYDFCEIDILIRDEFGNIKQEYLDENGNIQFIFPNFSEINSLCLSRNEFRDSYTNIDSMRNHDVELEFLNVYNDREAVIDLILNAKSNPSNIDREPNPQPNSAPKVAESKCPYSVTFNINFKGGSSVIEKSAKKQLNLIANLLKNCDYKKVKLSGYTSIDKPDSPSYKLFRKNLSFTRAISTKQAILSYKGIRQKSIEYIIEAKSELNALKSNKSEKTRSANRRVEIRLYK